MGSLQELSNKVFSYCILGKRCKVKCTKANKYNIVVTHEKMSTWCVLCNAARHYSSSELTKKTQQNKNTTDGNNTVLKWKIILLASAESLEASEWSICAVTISSYRPTARCALIFLVFLSFWHESMTLLGVDFFPPKAEQVSGKKRKRKKINQIFSPSK